MTRLLVAEFGQSEALMEALRNSHALGFPALDALTPYPIDGLDDALRLRPSPMRWPMLVAALVASAAAYGLEYVTAVDLYPFSSGARPLNSWQVFLLVPFEVGILAAAVAGFAALLIFCGLPRIDSQLFAFPLVDRASSDRFVLVFAAPVGEADARRLNAALFQSRALRIEASP